MIRRFSIVFLLLAAMPLMGQIPYQVKVINPTYSASIRDAVGMNGIGYFVAGSYLNFSNGQWDEELWRTDGTEAGTYRVKDIRVGQAGSNIKWMTVVGSTLYFSANDGTSGDELWKSDGTEAGTVRVVELSVGSGGGNLQSLVDYNGALHFIGTYANGSTYLFRSDGTAAGTVPVSTAVVPSAPTSINPDRRLTVWNGYLWFMGTNTSFTSSGLYRSDGTSAGTTLITTLDSPGSDMVAATNQLFFTANDPTYRREVWRSDGTAAGTYMTKDLNPINSGFNGSSSAWIYWTVGDVVVFSGVDGNPSANRKLYRSDGTAGGTHLLVDIYPGFSDVTNGSRTNADRTYMVWESRQQGGSSAPRLYVTDGTVAGTTHLKTFLSFCQNFMAMDGVMYFRANDGSAAGGTELWRTNGTVAGTYRYADINPGPGGSDPYPVGFFGNLGLLHAGPSYPQLWAFRLCNSSPQPAVSVAPSAVCAGNGAGTANVTNAASFTSYSWTIVNGAFDSPANGSSVSFHATSSNNVQLTVTATAVDGCQQQATVSVPTAAAPAATITPSGPTTFCEGGSVTLTAPSGMAGYLWSSGETTQAITVSAGGNYTVTVSNSSGCSATSSATPVTVNPAPATPVITASGPTTFCEGGGVTLTAPAGMSSYAWSNGATTQSILVSESGNYSVSVTNANGCSATSAATTVTVNPLPGGTITPSGPTTFCEGGSVTLTAPGGMSSYSWSTGATTQAITVNATGNYNVTFTNANGCSSTVGVPVQVNPSPAATITAGGPTTFCEGGSVTLTAGAAESYSWSNGTTTQSITVNASGNYSVTVTDANGCSASSAGTSVTVNPLPTTTITASGPTTFCEGGSVTLNAPAGMASYVWSNGATTESITVSAAGNYNVTVTNANGCSATSSPTPVTVSSVPTGLLSVVNTVCENVSNTATAQAIFEGAYVENATYAWSMTNGTITQVNGKHITFVSSTPGPATITVVITAANGCESAPITRTIEVMAPTIPTITANGPTAFCEGNSVTLTSSLAGSYLWSTGETTQSITVNASGNYSVTTTDSFNCGGTSAPVTVTVHPEATIPVVTASGPTTFCEGGSVTLTAPAGFTYLWSNGATTQSIVVNASGNYSVTTTNANGCSATSSPATVTVNPPPATPAITASGPTTFCEGGSVTLTAPAGFTYLWSNGATTQSITVNASGSYSVTVTNANGCSRSSAATSVTVTAPTVITTQPQNVTMRRGDTATLTAAATGTPNLQFQWYEGFSGDTSKPAGTGPTKSVGPYQKKGTYRFWVRVTSTTCTGSAANSVTATVTVN